MFENHFQRPDQSKTVDSCVRNRSTALRLLCSHRKGRDLKKKQAGSDSDMLTEIFLLDEIKGLKGTVSNAIGF